MWLYRIINFLGRWLFFGLLYPRTVYGRENMPKDGPVLIVCNHMRFHDVFNVASCFKRHVTFMAKRELIDMPLWGKLMALYGAFPVDRGNNDTQAIRTSIKVISEGKVLCIFPEGTRAHGEKLAPLKGGVAYVAGKTDCTVLPVYMNNPEKLFRRSYTIIGKPFKFEKPGRVDSAFIDAATQTLREKLLELCIYDPVTGKMEKWHEEK